MDKIVITKIEAACRQLNTAITLWFQDGDPVSIHSLVCSSHQIVHDLNKMKGGRDLIYDSLLIKDEYRKEANRVFKGPYNFMKHADKDPDDKLEFDPVNTDFFMMFTALGLELLGEPYDLTRSAFTVYYNLTHPEYLTPKGKEQFLGAIALEDRESVLNQPKAFFWEMYKKYAPNQQVDPTVKTPVK